MIKWIIFKHKRIQQGITLPQYIYRCLSVLYKVLAIQRTPWQTRSHCCGHIIPTTNASPFARARNICCEYKLCVRDTKNVSDFVQKHFVSATNVSQFAQPKKQYVLLLYLLVSTRAVIGQFSGPYSPGPGCSKPD